MLFYKSVTTVTLKRSIIFAIGILQNKESSLKVTLKNVFTLFWSGKKELIMFPHIKI